MRWLAHRGGALDFREFALANPGKPYPVAVVLGADPATILGAALVQYPIGRLADRSDQRQQQLLDMAGDRHRPPVRAGGNAPGRGPFLPGPSVFTWET